MKYGMNILSFGLILGLVLSVDAGYRPTWPPPPDQARVAWIDEVRFDHLKPESSFLGSIVRAIGGKSPEEKLSLPFDIVAVEGALFAVCQNIPALVEIDRDDNTFRLHSDKNHPFRYPVALDYGGEGRIYVSDPEAGCVFLFENGRVRPVIDSGLGRPTGLAVLPDDDRLFVVDTDDQSVKIYTLRGKLVTTLYGADHSTPFLYPTFASAMGDGTVLVNDGLNYKLRRFDVDGRHVLSFGAEGTGPGTFARPKGMAADSEGHIYVVDNLFDNVQVFDRTGQVLLVIGGPGQAAGQFWSPAGIDIDKDTVFIADTYNNRVQVLHYLGAQR